VLEQQEIRRRIRAAMHLAGIRSLDELAARTELSRSTLKDIGTVRARARETHLRVIAAACDLPYAWFTIPDIGRAVSREDEEPAVAERLEALERAIIALIRRDGGAMDPAPGPDPAPPAAGDPPPAPAGELGRRLQVRGTTSADPGRPGCAPEEGSEPENGG
jgi:lambda repressor-like predicted transcriptional regulator